MKTFKAKHNKAFYKNTDAWINAVYRNNKPTIDSELSWAGSPKKVFKQMVSEYISEGLTPTKAMSTIARSTLFTSASERLRTNAYQALKTDKEAYKAFRELTKEKGKYTSFDEAKLTWNKSEGVYNYDNVIISFKNSPYGIEIRRIE